MTRNASRPGGHSRRTIARAWPEATSQTRSTRPGSSTPISPLASTPSAAQAQASTTARRCGWPARSASAASAPKTIARAMNAATSMSRLANCAAAKKNGSVARTSTLASASAAPARRRVTACQPSSARPAPRSGASRAAAALAPKSLHRERRQPVEERRLVEERQAVLRRHDPVARAQHLPGDADVAAFFGKHERVQADREGEPREHGRGRADARPGDAQRPRRRLGHAQGSRVVDGHGRGMKRVASAPASG